MKVAITGTSSTGKTTLINYLLMELDWPKELRHFVSVDARKLLLSLGHHNMDMMTRAETKAFQLIYFHRKKEIEQCIPSFITDRSFIDVASYWVVRDTAGESLDVQEEIVIPCREEAKKYDLHIFLPFGLVPFVPDGYRPTNMDLHLAVERQIRNYLDDWDVEYRIMDTADLAERVARVKEWVREL